MGWFTRVKEGITTKCPECAEITTTEDHENNLWVCPKCGHHEKIGSAEYFALLFDDQKYKEIGEKLVAGDPLKFEDTKKYVDRLAKTRKETGLNDALRAAEGKLDKQNVVIACMDFRFIGGSMGSVGADRTGCGCGTEEEEPIDHHQQERRCPHDGGRLQSDADGEDQR
jgi:acetyl-CoA carboxylase carboxyl transferase subunit beta